MIWVQSCCWSWFWEGQHSTPRISNHTPRTTGHFRISWYLFNTSCCLKIPPYSLHTPFRISSFKGSSCWKAFQNSAPGQTTFLFTVPPWIAFCFHLTIFLSTPQHTPIKTMCILICLNINQYYCIFAFFGSDTLCFNSVFKIFFWLTTAI